MDVVKSSTGGMAEQDHCCRRRWDLSLDLKEARVGVS